MLPYLVQSAEGKITSDKPRIVADISPEQAEAEVCLENDIETAPTDNNCSQDARESSLVQTVSRKVRTAHITVEILILITHSRVAGCEAIWVCSFTTLPQFAWLSLLAVSSIGSTSCGSEAYESLAPL